MRYLWIIGLFTLISCDYREYPEEQEWKEEFMEKQEEERDINFTPGNF